MAGEGEKLETEQKEQVVKLKLNVFFDGFNLRRNGIVKLSLKVLQSNFVELQKLFAYQRSDAELWVRIGADKPQRIGRYVFDQCVLARGEGKLSFSAVRETVEMSRICSLPLLGDDVPEFELLCKIYVRED